MIDDLEPATKLRCGRCGTTEGVKRRGHSLAEAEMPGNPALCWDCNNEVSR